jgi:hypothetical protein
MLSDDEVYQLTNPPSHITLCNRLLITQLVVYSRPRNNRIINNRLIMANFVCVLVVCPLLFIFFFLLLT